LNKQNEARKLATTRNPYRSTAEFKLTR